MTLVPCTQCDEGDSHSTYAGTLGLARPWADEPDTRELPAIPWRRSPTKTIRVGSRLAHEVSTVLTDWAEVGCCTAPCTLAAYQWKAHRDCGADLRRSLHAAAPAPT